MIPILTSNQIRQADRHTIQSEPIHSLELMERASSRFTERFCALMNEKERRLHVFCGTGNNGADGLAISRLLMERGYRVTVHVTDSSSPRSADYTSNLAALTAPPHPILSGADFPRMERGEVVIDALFGSGLNRPLEGLLLDLVRHLNDHRGIRFCVDTPSGLFSDAPTPIGAGVVRGDVTIAFQTPRLAFFMEDCHQYVGEWCLEDIGMDRSFLGSLPTTYHYLEPADVRDSLPARPRFAHKGTMGKALLVAGSKGKMGAAVLSSRALLRSGIGLLFVHVPKGEASILQACVPEAMVTEDIKSGSVSKIAIPGGVDVVGIGPGIGTGTGTGGALLDLLRTLPSDLPVALDADALNLISVDKELKLALGRCSRAVLTPHDKEFERMAGLWKNGFERLELLRGFCKEFGVTTVLKGAFTAVCDPTGRVSFNSSGNPGMATPGSGDVLLGVLTGILGRVSDVAAAARLGVYLHGSAGDFARSEKSETSLIASDVVESLPAAFKAASQLHVVAGRWLRSPGLG